MTARKERPTTTNQNVGGGVAIYTRSDLMADEITLTMPDACAISLTVGQLDLHILNIYCPPQQLRLDTDLITTFINTDANTILTGDLNAKHHFFGSTTTNNKGDDLFDLTEQHDLTVANDPQDHTRLNPRTGETELLDYIIVPKCCRNKISSSFTGPGLGSDHFPLHVTLDLAVRPPPPDLIQIRPYNKCDWTKFKEGLHDKITEIRLDNELTNKDGIDKAIQNIEQVIKQTLDEVCPLKTIKNFSSSLDKETIVLIKLRRKLRRLKQKNPDLRPIYNIFRNLTDTAISKDRRRKWHSATEDLNHQDGRKFWQTFGRLTGCKNKDIRAPRLTRPDGTKTNTPSETADCFSETLALSHTPHTGPNYDKETEEVVKDFIQTNEDRLTPSFTQRQTEDHWLTDKVTTEELDSALKKCKNNSSPGPDNIKYITLKHLPPTAKTALINIYSACITTGYFPLRWKTAIGTMIPKPHKDKTRPTNYRPISLLNTMGKTLERIIKTRLTTHLTETHPINDFQRAYQTGKDAADIHYRLSEEIHTSTTTRQMTAILSLDVEKAFDTVWHDGLRYKLDKLDIPDPTLRLLSSFLSDRTISVKINDSLSRPARLRAGTPQGSVLSPLLYIIYVNDVPLQDLHARAGQFADDLSTWTTTTNLTKAKLRLQRPLDKIEDWANKWKVKINVDKTQFMYTTDRSRTKTGPLRMLGQDINPSSNLKLLGLTFDKKGTFHQHCKTKADEATARTRLLRRLTGTTWGANTKTLLRLYKQYIRPVLEYGAVALTRAAPKALERLAIVERKALRLAIKAPPRTRNVDLYTAANLRPITDRIQDLSNKTIARLDMQSPNIIALKKVIEASQHFVTG